MLGESLQIDQSIKEIVGILNDNQDDLLKEYQTKHCSACNGAVKTEKVWKSPNAYRIGLLLRNLKEYGYFE